MKSADNRSALITGVSTGIGLSIALKLLNEGFMVFGSVRKIEDAKDLVTSFPENFVPLVFDVTDEKSINDSVGIVREKLNNQGLGVLINNAGIAFGGPLLYMESSLIKQHFEVNVFGVINAIKAFAPLLGAVENYPGQPGKIINMGSVSGKIGSPFVAPYVGSKHALEGISQSLRRELIPFGIDVILVGPGVVKTPIWKKAKGKADYSKTPYAKYLGAFAKKVNEKEPNGLEPDRIANLVYKIIQNKKPKTRYSISPDPFSIWLARHILPDRTLDNIFAKKFKMK